MFSLFSGIRPFDVLPGIKHWIALEVPGETLSRKVSSRPSCKLLIARGQDLGAQSWQTKSFVIITIPQDCIDRVTAQSGDRALFERFPTPRPASTRWRAAWAAAAPAQLTHRRTKSLETEGKQGRSARRLETRHRSGPGTWKPEAIHFSHECGYSSQWHGGQHRCILEKWSCETRIQKSLKESKLVHIKIVFAKMEKFCQESSPALFEIGNVEVIELKTSIFMPMKHSLRVSMVNSLRLWKASRPGYDATNQSLLLKILKAQRTSWLFEKWKTTHIDLTQMTKRRDLQREWSDVWVRYFLDHITQIDISHTAPHSQRERYNNLHHLRSEMPFPQKVTTRIFFLIFFTKLKSNVCPISLFNATVFWVVKH